MAAEATTAVAVCLLLYFELRIVKLVEIVKESKIVAKKGNKPCSLVVDVVVVVFAHACFYAIVSVSFLLLY